MDLTDQRLACLRMAMELNCKTEPLLKAANELMSFIATGSAHTPAQNDAKPEVETAAAEPAIDTIAACGTALQMPDVGGLEAAQPANPPSLAESLAETPPADSEVRPEPEDVAEAGVADADPAANGQAELSEAATEAAPEGGTDSEAPVPEVSAEHVTEVTEGEVAEADTGTLAEVVSQGAAETPMADANPEQPAAVH
jgi:hypothetical protein